MQLRHDEHRTALGFLTLAETDALVRVRILDPYSTLVSSGVQIGPDTVVYPGVVIQRDAASMLSLGSGNVLYPGTLLMAERGGQLRVGDNCELGPGGVQVKANMPDAEIVLGDGVRLLNGAELTGRSNLGNGAQIIGPVSAQSVQLAGGLGGHTWPDPDERGALLKGTGLARGLSLARGEVVSCQPSFADGDVERQARYHSAQHHPTQHHPTQHHPRRPPE
jgi:carbonic anhydrase/acetyltransferase-like protein (isoleucine patch superfamily)